MKLNSYRTSSIASGAQALVRGAASLSLAGALSLGSLLATGQPVTAQTASVGTAAASITPDTAAFYFGFTTDIESPQWQLADELLQRAGSPDSINGLIEQSAEDMAGDSGAGVQDVGAILGGEAAIVVTDAAALASDTSDVVGEGEDSGSSIFGDIAIPAGVDTSGLTGAVVVIEPGDIDAAKALIESDLTSGDSTITPTTTDYNGTTIVSVAGDPETGDSGTAYAIVGDFIIVSGSPKDLQPFIDTAAGTGSALADKPAFGKADSALSGDRLGFGFADAASLEQGIQGIDTEELDLSAIPTDVLGVPSSTGISIIADQQGFRINTVSIPSEDAVAPVADAPVGDLTFADKVPDDTLIFVNGFNLGQGALLQALGLALVTAFNSVGNVSDATPVVPPSADELYQKAAMLIGFNLNTDFIQQMTGEYGFALWNVNLEDPSQINAILTSNVDQPAVLTDALSKISLLVQAAGQGQVNVTTRLIGDAQVSSIDIMSEGEHVATLEYGVVNGEFMLGVGGAIDSYVAGTTNSLADSPDYQAALAALPADHTGVFFVNAAGAVTLANETMNSMDLGSYQDASSECSAYSTQAAAQEAYDADSVENFILDMDFDGQACEDFFSAATPMATPIAGNEYAAVRAFATVSFSKDGLDYTNSILLIQE